MWKIWTFTHTVGNRTMKMYLALILVPLMNMYAMHCWREGGYTCKIRSTYNVTLCTAPITHTHTHIYNRKIGPLTQLGGLALLANYCWHDNYCWHGNTYNYCWHGNTYIHVHLYMWVCTCYWFFLLFHSFCMLHIYLLVCYMHVHVYIHIM